MSRRARQARDPRGAFLLLLLTSAATAHAQAASSTSTTTTTTHTASAPLAAPPLDLGPLPVQLDAELFRAEPHRGLYTAEGHAMLRRGGLTVFADRLLLDRGSGAVIAEGHVVTVEGPAVLTCTRVVLHIPDLGGAIDDAVLRIKHGRADATSAESAQNQGQDTMRLTAAHLERTGPRAFAVDDADFTPCRCAEGEPPDWKLGAASADVDVDRGAWLYGPVLYVRDVPVFALPVLYVPLGERRTGLLLPRADYTATQGFSATLPLYVTLGRSWDATLDASWWLDRGPAPGLELRWAPATNQEGHLHTTILLDRGVKTGSTWSADRADLLPRFAVTGRHRGRVDDTTIAADLNLAGDLDFISEFGAELLDRQVEESVSRITVATTAADHLRVAGGLALRQDLRPRDYPAVTDRRLIHLFDPDHDLAYRFAELRIDALPYPLLSSPISPIARARLIADATGTLRDTTDIVGRVDLRPSLSLPLASRGLSLVPEAALRLLGTTRASGSEGRIAAHLHTTASVELHRDYGPITHVIRPRAEHAALTLLTGDERAPDPLDDELALARPAHQLIAALQNELYLEGRATRFANLDLAFPLDLLATAGARKPIMLAHAEVDAPLPIGSLRLGGKLELDDGPTEVSEWRVWASTTLANLGSASVTYASLGPRPPLGVLVAGEELVYASDVPLPTPWASFRGVVASLAVTPIPALRIDASALIDAGTPDAAQGGKLRLLRGGVSWTSPCECWAARVAVEKSSDRDLPSVHVTLDLAQVGGTGF